jgi:hypothetical protein
MFDLKAKPAARIGTDKQQDMVPPDTGADPKFWLPERYSYIKKLLVLQCFGSGYVLDPDTIRSADPFPYSESGSGSRRAKMIHKSRKN